jgi:hypothetical protein
MQSPFVGVSAHPDQSRWLIGTNMDMGIKGSNNEPQAQIRWREPSMRMGIVQHDKDDGDINGTIEVIANSFVPDHPDQGRCLLNR